MLRAAKLDVLEWVAALDDAEMIQLLNDIRITQSEIPPNPYSNEAMVRRALETEEDIKAGNTIPFDEVKKQFLKNEEI